jgi:DNA invertase Pin-like site-specific DNA recombinase
MSKIILLSRVSTGLQDLEQQTEQLINYAKSIGYKEQDFIVIEDKESAVKLSEEERQGLNKMKEAIANYPVKDVVIYELSRLSRVPKILYSVRDFLVEHHVQLHILNPSIKLLKQDGTIDESANVIFSLFCSLAENEGYLRKQRFARGKAKLRSENKYTGGTVMFGYMVNKDLDFVIKEDEASIVRRIFEEYQTKIITDIAKDLVLEGLLPNASVNSASTLVRSVLHRELYYGKEIEMNGYKRKYPPIISKETFDEAAKKFTERKKYSKTKSKHVYLCRGIVFNINNEPLTPLYCHNSYSYIKVKKYNWETLSIKMDLLDKVALHCAIENKKRKPGKDMMKYKVELQQELKVISKKVSTIDKKIEEANDRLIKIETRYIYGKITEEMVNILSLKENNIINSLKEEHHHLEAEGEDLKKRLNNLLQNGKESFLGHFSELTLQEQYQIVHEEIEKIIVIKGKSQNSFTLGVQFINGDYMMLDLNTRSGKLWNENGELIEYENLH